MQSLSKRKVAGYLGIVAALVVVRGLFADSEWTGSTELHTIMETAATLLALTVGLSALFRFYSHKSNLMLFVGAGFLGAAFLDGYHTVVTSAWFADRFPSPPPSLSPWSWNASRIFLGSLMFLGWWAWKREAEGEAESRIRERTVYTVVATMTAASFLFFTLVPLPRAYYTGIFGRPEELVAGALLLLALAGYLWRGTWRDESLVHWLVISLIVGAAAQIVFMSFSHRLFDGMFDIAHLLKIASYASVMVGLMVSMRALLTRAYESAEKLRKSEVRFRTFFESAPVGIYQSTPDGKVLAANAGLVGMLGYESTEELMRLPTIADLYVRPGQRRALNERVDELGAVRDYEIELRRKDGSHLVALVSSRAVRDENGETLHYEGTLTDITERKKYEKTLERMAQFDALTGLPNRARFEDRLEQAIRHSTRSGGRVSLHYLDLDDFKAVNDNLGHSSGDDLLKQVAQRLSGVVRGDDTLARLGGDEFALIQTSSNDVAAVSTVARTLMEALSKPFDIGTHKVYTATSIGIAQHTGDLGPEELMAQADAALYKAKSKGRGTFEFHDEELAREVREYGDLHRGLHGALERDELFLEYQPQIDLKTGRVVGFEALVRWLHPERGRLEPNTFVPVCERSGLMERIGQWVLEEACRFRQSISAPSFAGAQVAVNISAIHLKDGQSLEESVLGVLDATGLPAELLELELTEGLLMNASAPVLAALRRLHVAGVRFAIDDFGVGYSSLLYLRTFPFHRLKIAPEFVRRVTFDGDHRAIVEAMIGLGKNFGLEILAEGVETEEQVKFLRGHGCDEAQGFLFAQPTPGEDLLLWATERVTAQR